MRVWRVRHADIRRYDTGRAAWLKAPWREMDAWLGRMGAGPLIAADP